MITLHLGPATTPRHSDAYVVAREVWNRPAPKDWTAWQAMLTGLPVAPQKDLPVAVVANIWQGWAVVGAGRYFTPSATEPQIAVVLHHPQGPWAVTSLPQNFIEGEGPRVGWHELEPEDQHHTGLTCAEDHTYLSVEALSGFVDGLAAAHRGDWVDRMENHWVLPTLMVGSDEKALARAGLRILWAHCAHEDMSAVRTLAALGSYGSLPDNLGRHTTTRTPTTDESCEANA